MTIYRRVITPVPISGAFGAAHPALRPAYGPRMRTKARQRDARASWEDEGGSLAAPAFAPKSS
jgi:hypothetical protein